MTDKTKDAKPAEPEGALKLDAETVKDLEPAENATVRGGRSSSGKSIAGSIAGSHVT